MNVDVLAVLSDRTLKKVAPVILCVPVPESTTKPSPGVTVPVFVKSPWKFSVPTPENVTVPVLMTAPVEVTTPVPIVSVPPFVMLVVEAAPLVTVNAPPAAIVSADPVAVPAPTVNVPFTWIDDVAEIV